MSQGTDGRMLRSQLFEEAENAGTNDSADPTMGDIIAARMSRRDIMKGALATTAVAAVLPAAIPAPAAAQGTNTTPSFNFK
jgi:hypothetical protein